MDLHVVTPHVAKVYRKRCRNPEHARYWGGFVVDIPEISKEDAPVATWRKASPDDVTVGDIVETRWFDGSHWMPRILNLESGPLLVDQDFLIDHARAKDDFLNPFVKGHSLRGISDTLDPRGEFYRLIEDDGSESAMTKASKIARNLTLIDGEVWERVHEPVYRLNILASSDNTLSIRHVTDPLRIECCLNPPKQSWKGTNLFIHPSELFAADQVEQMLAHFRLYKDVEVVPELTEEQHIEILIPESIRFDIDHHVVKTRVDQALSDTVLMHKWDDQTITAWMAVRREYERDLGSDVKPDSDLDRLCPALREFAALKDDHHKKDITSAVDRWEFRPLDLDFGDQFAASAPQF